MNFHLLALSSFDVGLTCWWFWTRLHGYRTGLEELQSSEDDDEDGNKDSVSALSPSSAEVLVPEDVEPEQISRYRGSPRPSDDFITVQLIQTNH